MKTIKITEEQAQAIIAELSKIYGYEWGDDSIHADNCGKGSDPLIAMLEEKLSGYDDDEISFDPDSIEAILRNKGRLDEHVHEIFGEYCEIFGIHRAYGVEEWEDTGNYLYIKQDISCRGCYDCTYHNLPNEWLYLTGDKLTAAIQASFDEKKKKKEEEKARQKAAKEARERAEYERLKNKFEEK